jgi:excisionase family DNA binding protein
MKAVDIAEYLRLTPATVLRMADAGQLPNYRVGGAYRFSRAEIDAMFDSAATDGQRADNGGNPTAAV